MDMIIDTTINLENLIKSRESILDLMGNPYCDHLMFMNLNDKLEEVDAKIEELIDKE